MLIVFSLVLFSSCEKEIDLDLEDKSGDIVIEGNVTDQAGPYYVRVTKSVGFTENNQYPPVSDALVTISDNTGQSEILTYEADGRYKTTHFVTAPGNTYTLNVVAGGVTYTAQSTMPEPVPLDDLTQDSFAFGDQVSYSVIPVFTDPATLGNRYLFVVSVNGRTDKRFQTFSDNTNNGMVNQRSLSLPRDPMDDDQEVVIGDTIHVEMQCIDQDIYIYYNALIEISGSGTVTPANPPSNISNGALGYFSAHTTESKSIIIE